MAEGRRVGRALGAIAILLIAFADGALLGGYLGNEAGRRSAAEAQELRQRLTELQAAHSILSEEVAVLKSASELDRLALFNAQKALATLQEQLAEANRELDLYRRIASSDATDEALTIEGFEIVRNGGLRYRLTLSQGAERESEVQGVVRISIHGRIGDERQSLELKDFDGEHADGLSFSFQYFQLLSGAIVWPERFVPESVEVRVLSHTSGVGDVFKRWDWKEIVSG